jgi:hypothetical protein
LIDINSQLLLRPISRKTKPNPTSNPSSILWSLQAIPGKPVTVLKEIVHDPKKNQRLKSNINQLLLSRKIAVKNQVPDP